MFIHTNLEKQQFHLTNSDFREPAISVRKESEPHIPNFTYDSFKILEGKPKLKGLPATYANDHQDASTLQIFL